MDPVKAFAAVMVMLMFGAFMGALYDDFRRGRKRPLEIACWVVAATVAAVVPFA